MKMLWNVGTHYSATNPLWLSLCHDNKYMHTGHKKEISYFYNLQQGIKVTGCQTNPRSRKAKVFPHLYSSYTHDYFITNTIEDYIDYYTNHWEHIKNEYQSLGDFSNHYAGLTPEFVATIADKLNAAFDMKVTMIFRDPIRRLFSASETNKRFQQRLNGIEPPSKTQRWKDKGMKYSHYDRIYNTFAQHFDTHVIIMEQLWKDHSGLSKFLNYDIKTLHHNCYHNMSTKPEYLKDQWNSDKQNISQESMDMAKKKMKHIYENFESTFGYIPEEWEYV